MGLLIGPFLPYSAPLSLRAAKPTEERRPSSKKAGAVHANAFPLFRLLAWVN